MMSFLLMMGVPVSLALTPPMDWTLTAPDRAERNPGAPGEGVLLELASTEGTVETLSLLLVDNGMMVQQSAMDGEHINLVLSDQRLGRAQWDSAGQRWLVLLVAAPYAAQMDPDALLLSAMASSTLGEGSVWGADAGGEAVVSAVSGGRDGTPWGEGTQTAATTAATSGGWVDAATMQAWDHDEAVLGIWECSVMRGGSPAQMTFTFETDGTVRLEEQISGRTERYVGTWATREGVIQLLSLPGADTSVLNAYQAMGGTLRFTYDRIRLTLYKQ